MRLITNTNDKENNRMDLLLRKHGVGTRVLVASAFFNHSSLVSKMIDNNCVVKLIVRLDVGTDADALLKIIDNPDITIRYYTGRSFHPKFYIFGNDTAYVGSSNFTISGLGTNNEVNIEFDAEEPIFDDLEATFFDYWQQAADLTKEKILAFRDSIKGLGNEAWRVVEKAVGTVEFNNVGREPQKLSKQDSFVLDFKKQYNSFIKKFGQLQEIFEETKIRKFPDNVPLRIEIDRFLWWLSNDYAKGDSYETVQEKSISEIKTIVVPLVQEYASPENKYINENAVFDYLLVEKGFESVEKIKNLDYDELLEVFVHIYAFHDRLRYFSGGLETMKEKFKEDNSLDNVKRMIVYLLFGEDEYEFRLFQCIHGDYRLRNFGENCCKELYGLVNRENIPIYNQRVAKSMQWLGFGKL